MATTKRTTEPPTKRARKNKKARKDAATTPEPVVLGSTSTSTNLLQKDQEELDLEEAVFGRVTDTVDPMWDLAEDDIGKGKGKMRLHDQDADLDEDDLDETGLERLKDDNVRSFCPSALPQVFRID